MMNKDEIMNKLLEMRGRIFALTSSDKKFIEENQEIVLRRKFTRTGCGDCFRDAIILMINYLKKNNIMEKKSSYQLKPGASIVLPEGYFNNFNLTDDIAENYLREKSKRINKFIAYPENWESRVNKTKKEKQDDKENTSEKTGKKTVLKEKPVKQEPIESTESDNK